MDRIGLSKRGAGAESPILTGFCGTGVLGGGRADARTSYGEDSPSVTRPSPSTALP